MKAADQVLALPGVRTDQGRGKSYDLASTVDAYLPANTDIEVDGTR